MRRLGEAEVVGPGEMSWVAKRIRSKEGLVPYFFLSLFVLLLVVVVVVVVG